MLRCYLLALVSGSSVDQLSNNFTLFNLVEQMTIVEELLGQDAPVELHAYWLVSQEAREQDFEIRVIRLLPGREPEFGAALPLRTGPQERLRFRSGKFRVPNAYGSYLLTVEWRLKGSENWTRDPILWPLQLVPQVAAPTPPPVTHDPAIAKL